MQDWPLTVDRILDHAARRHANVSVVSREPDGSLSRMSYAAVHERAKRLSNALRAAGIGAGDRVATLAMNSGRHLEVWYGTMGMGAVCHTLNPRLFDDQLVYIINHAADRALFADELFAPQLLRLLPRCPTIEWVVWLARAPSGAAPTPRLATPARYYEPLMAEYSADGAWGGFSEETAAGLCYTSGTTGSPKGVLYSHRSNVLHTLITLQADIFAIGARDVVLPIVPMFHANAWGLVFSVPAVGARLVLPGAQLDGPSIHELIEREEVTFAAGVPTVWQTLLHHLDSVGGGLGGLRRAVIGGAACPPYLMRRLQDDYQVEVIHAWGMTEMSPVGTVNTPTAEVAVSSAEEREALRAKQGRVPFGVEMKLSDETGASVAEDGREFGRLKVRGVAVARAYFGAEDGAILDSDGFFDTGDIATIDRFGFMQITDRAKDLIKSGGEWISSIELENIATSHPAVLLAAVIAAPHPNWGERPLLFAKLKPDAALTASELLAHFVGKVARWSIPDEARIVEDIPLNGAGKIDKKRLRERLEIHTS
jgi:fatty-acyl-CoA synthase